jgi:hypothetical protein
MLMILKATLVVVVGEWGEHNRLSLEDSCLQHTTKKLVFSLKKNNEKQSIRAVNRQTIVPNTRPSLPREVQRLLSNMSTLQLMWFSGTR